MAISESALAMTSTFCSSLIVKVSDANQQGQIETKIEAALAEEVLLIKEVLAVAINHLIDNFEPHPGTSLVYMGFSEKDPYNLPEGVSRYHVLKFRALSQVYDKDYLVVMDINRRQNAILVREVFPQASQHFQ